MKANVKNPVKNERIVPVAIAGMSAHFNFSLYAAKVIAKEYKGLENLEAAMGGKDGGEGEAIEVMSEVYALLLNEGAEYLSLRAKMAGIELEFSPFTATARELQTLLGLDEMKELAPLFFEAIKIGTGRTVEAKADPKKPKPAQKA